MRLITLFFAVAVMAVLPIMSKDQGANTNRPTSKAMELPAGMVFPRSANTNGQESKMVEQPAGTVVFPRGGISFEVGAGWKQVTSKLPPPVCPPMLVGTGILRTILFA